MSEIVAQYWSLISAAVFSLILIAIFVYIKSTRPKLLEIETKWLGLSLLPVIIVLLTGGYIYKFKGFGIEIETSLKEPIKNNVELKAEEVMVGDIGDVKSTLEKLYGMSGEERSRIERLSFKNEYPGYDPGAVKEYLNMLPNLEYIELLGADLKFMGVMLADDLKGKENEFVGALKNGTVMIGFRNFIVTEFLDYDSGAIEALALVRESGRKFLPLLDRQGYMKGVVTEAALEKRIADEVLRAGK